MLIPRALAPYAFTILTLAACDTGGTSETSTVCDKPTDIATYKLPSDDPADLAAVTVIYRQECDGAEVEVAAAPFVAARPVDGMISVPCDVLVASANEGITTLCNPGQTAGPISVYFVVD